MRRTKAALIYKATGNLRSVQILLGHTNIKNTAPGDDRNGTQMPEVSERTDAA